MNKNKERETMKALLVGMALLGIVLLVSIPSVYACSFDTDCDPGYVCVKGSGIDGTCMRRY